MQEKSSNDGSSTGYPNSIGNRFSHEVNTKGITGIDMDQLMQDRNQELQLQDEGDSK